MGDFGFMSDLSHPSGGAGFGGRLLTWAKLGRLGWGMLIGLTGEVRAVENALTWEAFPVATEEAYAANAKVRIELRNESGRDVVINKIQKSCGCTMVQAPALPWRLAPGEQNEFVAQVDLKGKQGILHKTVTLKTNVGSSVIKFAVQAPSRPEDERRRDNQLVALSDATAIFRGDCATCHANPGEGLNGAALYAAVCAICHDAEPRAAAVPPLPRGDSARSSQELQRWITHGLDGSMMPGFATENGGILDDAQVRSLVDYLNLDSAVKF